MKYCLLLACVAVVVAGCKESTDTSLNEITQAFSLPGVGSHFTYQVWSTDSNGAMRAESVVNYDFTAESTVEGKTDAIEVSQDGQRTGYMHREANGNLSWYQGGWKEIPVATRNAFTYISRDTTIYGDIIMQKETYSYLGYGNAHARTQKFRCRESI
jgi:hypothetical protein